MRVSSMLSGRWTVFGFALLALMLWFVQPAEARMKKEILIGTNLPLTGILAGVGIEQRWVYQTAVDDVNKAGGIWVKEVGKRMPVRLVVADDASDPGKAAALSIPADSGLEDQDLVIVNAPDHLFSVGYLGATRFLEGFPLPRRMRALVTTPVPLALTRMDERTLRAEIEGGMLKGPLGDLYRDPRRPLGVGDQVELEGMTVDVAAVTPRHGPRSGRRNVSAPAGTRPRRSRSACSSSRTDADRYTRTPTGRDWCDKSRHKLPRSDLPPRAERTRRHRS